MSDDACREPVGEHCVLICTTTPCMLGGVGSDVILEAIQENLGEWVELYPCFFIYAAVG